jgi:hypothetical protein
VRRRDYYWSLYHGPEKRQLNDLRTDQVEAIFEAIPDKNKTDWAIWREGFQSWKPLIDFPALLVSLRRVARLADEAPIPAPPSGSRSGITKLDPVEEAKAAPQAEKSKTEKPASKSAPKASEKKSAQPTDAKQVIETKRLDRVVTPHAEGTLVKTSDNTVAGLSVHLKRPEDDNESEVTAEARLRAVDEADEADEPELLSLADLRIDEDRDSVRFKERFEIRIIVGENVYTNSTADISIKGMQLREPLPKGLPRYFNVEIKTGESVIPVVCSEVKRDNDGICRLRIEVNDYVNALKTVLLGRATS